MFRRNLACGLAGPLSVVCGMAAPAAAQVLVPSYPAAPVYVAPGYVAPGYYVGPAAPVGAPSVKSQSWYYCDNPKGYYPSVQSCAGGWREVPAQAR